MTHSWNWDEVELLNDKWQMLFLSLCDDAKSVNIRISFLVFIDHFVHSSLYNRMAS